MCGLAGFGIGEDKGLSELQRFTLTLALGREIDDRGGHGIGFTAIEKGQVAFDRSMADWSHADLRFIESASRGSLTMLHARYATCGKKTETDAHPFLITRDEKPILYGMHNGMIDNARQSAVKNERTFTVDSLELLELLADGKFDEIAKLQGYGTLVWVRCDDMKTIRMVRMTNHADLYVSRTDKGFVYGSTEPIVKLALEQSGLKEEAYYNLDVGQVYGLRTDGFFVMTDEKVTLSDRWTAAMGRMTSGGGFYNGGLAGKNVIPFQGKKERSEEGSDLDFSRDDWDDWYKDREKEDKGYFDSLLNEAEKGEPDEDDEDDLFEEIAYDFIDGMSSAQINLIVDHGIDAKDEEKLKNEYGLSYPDVEKAIYDLALEFYTEREESYGQ